MKPRTTSPCCSARLWIYCGRYVQPAQSHRPCFETSGCSHLEQGHGTVRPSRAEVTLIKSQTQIREWRCAFRGSVSESAGAARDGARPRQTSHSSAGGRPTACSPALISDRDLFPTRGRETAAASNCHFGLAPGASAKVPLPGISARPGFSQDSGELPAEQKQKKKKKKKAAGIPFLTEGSPERGWGSRPGTTL